MTGEDVPRLSPGWLFVEIVIILLILAGAILTAWVLLTFELSLVIQVVLVVLEFTLLLLVGNRAIAIATSTVSVVQRMIVALIEAWYDIKHRITNHRDTEKRRVEIIFEPLGRNVVVIVEVNRRDIEQVYQTLTLLGALLKATEKKHKDAEDKHGPEENRASQ